MPPRAKARQSSPGIRTTRASKTPAKKPRASEPINKAGKRKNASESDEEGPPKKRKGGGKKQVQEIDDDEEEEEEEEEIEGIKRKESENEGSPKAENTQDGLQDIYKELSTKFQAKKGKKSTKKDTTTNKDVQKLDELFDDVLETIEVPEPGEERDGHQSRKRVIDEFNLQLADKYQNDVQKLSKVENLIDHRAKRWTDVFPHYRELSKVHQHAIIEALDNAIDIYEKRPKVIEVTIKEFTKLQKERIKEGQERAEQILDPRKIVHNSKKLMFSVIKRS